MISKQKILIVDDDQGTTLPFKMGLENQVGSITKGKIANLIITKEIPNYYQIPYSFGTNLIDKVLINGEVFNQ